jgi:hypothetical protein
MGDFNFVDIQTAGSPLAYILYLLFTIRFNSLITAVLTAVQWNYLVA